MPDLLVPAEIRSTIDLDNLIALSERQFVIIFKYSTRCGISRMVYRRMLSAELNPELYTLHTLDVLSYKSVSNAVSSEYQVRHESPQALVIKDGKCIFHCSHEDVSPENILEFTAGFRSGS